MRKPLILTALMLAGVFGVMLLKGHNQAPPAENAAAHMSGQPASETTPGATKLVAAPNQPTPIAPTTPTALSDGKDLDSIRKWAHNELEVQRMAEENSRIIRRELVTFKETPAAAIERCRLAGEPVRELTLPGLDGQNIQFEITKSDVEPSGLRGMFSGRIAGQPDSLVTLAFAKNKQAYTVLSPSAGIYLTADAHDSGDAILKSIQPDIYASGYCGNP